MASNSNNEESKALKAGVGYTLGNILVKGITFVSIPLFARLLTVSDYGVVNTFSAYVSIFFYYYWIRNAYQYQECKD